MHSQLNPALFEGEHLKDEVRQRLIEVADLFINELKEKGIPLSVHDYWMVGSNAAYNYTPGLSDIDVHVIVDTDDVDVNPEVLRILYDYARSDFNQKYDISAKGQPVELYLEDLNASAVSNGIYSLKKDEWIKKPKKLKDVEISVEETPEFAEALSKYTEAMQSTDVEHIKEVISDLYMMRKESLATEGEFGRGNLIFKEFRNLELLQNLKDRVHEIISQNLTLEKLEVTK